MRVRTKTPAGGHIARQKPKTAMKLATFAMLVGSAAAHSNLISPKPRNAVDSVNDPRWAGGKSPDKWQPYGDNPCACRNGSSTCAVGQTCLWMSVGCSIGCAECDGGTIKNKSVGTNPNGMDRCSSGKKPWTNNKPEHRTFNRVCTGSCVGTADDFTKYNPWRAPGAAPVYDACGRAGGGPHPTGGHGEYIDTANAKFGDMGSKLPRLNSGAVWKAGSTVEALWNVRANHGGGYQCKHTPAFHTTACVPGTFLSDCLLGFRPPLPGRLRGDRGVLPQDADALRRQLQDDDVQRHDAPAQLHLRHGGHAAGWFCLADAPDPDGPRLVSPNEAFCIQNEAFCIQNEELCIKKRGIVYQKRGIVYHTRDF